MSFKILKIKEKRFELSTIAFERDQLILSSCIDLKFKPDDKEVEIFFHCAYGAEEDKEFRQIAHIDTEMTFLKEDFKDTKTFKNKFLKSEELKSMIGFLISATRGMLFIRTKGHEVNEFFLPIMSPGDLVKDYLKAQTSKEVTKQQKRRSK